MGNSQTTIQPQNLPKWTSMSDPADVMMTKDALFNNFRKVSATGIDANECQRNLKFEVFKAKFMAYQKAHYQAVADQGKQWVWCHADAIGNI